MNRRDFIRQGSAAAVVAFGARAFGANAPVRRLRIAQIGTAHSHAAGKWEALCRRNDLFDCRGIWEPDPAQRRAAQRRPEYAGARWLDEAEFFGGDLEAVAVETELPDLLAMGRRVLESGWHLHLDKPPGTDLAAFAAVQDLAARRGRVLQTGYMFRYHPAFRFCLRAAQAGWLGSIFAVHGDIGKVIAPDRRAWLAENYGGSMMLLGCHLLDLTVALLGLPDRATPYRRRTRPEHDAFFDNEMAVLEYPRAVATIRSLLCEVGGDERRQFVVCGENGTVEVMPLEPARVRLTLQKPAGGYPAGASEVPLPEVKFRYDEMLRDFHGRANGAPSLQPKFDAAHDLAVQRLLLQVGRA
ncbi:MAG TPA: Gfo/Idh/MocA family oxidoreductase [Lacunisphaera sp.]|nr:Gfo/Idh/MocA family oxidoreductase [Lacunisphaera sp.]